jgi:hypothetical protein
MPDYENAGRDDLGCCLTIKPQISIEKCFEIGIAIELFWQMICLMSFL